MKRIIINIKLQKHIKPWYHGTNASVAAEYALMITAVALAIFAAVYALGDEILALYTSFYNLITN